MYRLPTGQVTHNPALYAEAWTKLGDTIAPAIGATVIGYDRGVTFWDGYTSCTLSTICALNLYQSLTGDKYTLPAPEAQLEFKFMEIYTKAKP